MLVRVAVVAVCYDCSARGYYYVVIDKYDFMNTQVSVAKANPARKLRLLMDEGSADRCDKL